MQNSYLIDGYNLIHALGMIQKHLDPGGLEASRKWLLDYLVQSFGEGAWQVTVVFDAKEAPRGVPRTQQFHGIAIQFAPKKQSADDVIETLIEEHKEPRKLVVVSNDTRLKNAAHRRGAQAWSHEELLDFLEQRQPETPTPAPTEERNNRVSPDEAKKWLKEFMDVEDDPDLKEFFDHDRFE